MEIQFIRLVFDDLLCIAAAIREVPADELEPTIDRVAAEAALAAPFVRTGEIDLYPLVAEKAAICCSRVILYRPLREDNKRVAYECLREMLLRGGCPWPRPEEDEEEIAAKIDALALGAITETDFVRWVRARVGLGEWLRYLATA
jgi:prophage maintenance system killer protein